MFEEYRRRVGLVIEAARMVRGKTQEEVAREARKLGLKTSQSSISWIERGGGQTLDSFMALASALEVELWVLLRIAAGLPKGCTESPKDRAKALGLAIVQIEEIRDAQQ